MADDRPTHPAPIPSDADAFEAALAERWRTLDDDGPSELDRARILRAAREARATSPVVAPPARRATTAARWSAAAGLLLALGTSVLLWRADNEPPAVLTEAEPMTARSAADRSAAVEEPAERLDAQKARVPARREIRTVTAPPAASAFVDDAADVSAEASAPAPAAPVALAEAAGAAQQTSFHELEGRLLRDEDDWRLAHDGRVSALDLSALTGDARAALASGARVRIRFQPQGDRLLVLRAEALPADSELADEPNP